MTQESTLIATLAIGFGLAMILGFLAVKLRMPALVGYLLAGVAIGPHTRGFVGDVNVASELAEIGVMLLMFGVGLHFSLEGLASVGRLVTVGAAVQMTVAAAAGFALAVQWGWTAGAALVFGLCLSVSSTVVLLKSLESRRLLTTFNGRLTTAWLIVQDLVMVLVLVLVPALAPALGGTAAGEGSRSLALSLAITAVKVVAFIAIMWFAGRHLFPWLLWIVAKTGSRELFTLCVIAAAIGVAYASAVLFGVSFALGAFFAGMMLRESPLSQRAAEHSLPLQDAFAVLFFLSVGMLFDPAVLMRAPLRVLMVVAVVMIANSAAAIAAVLAFRYPLRTALTVGAGLTQIGEFSFILAGLGVSVGLLSTEGQNLVLAAALTTIALNPLVFAVVEPVEERLRRSPRPRVDPLAELPMTTDPAILTGHVVLVGYGRVGRRIAQTLAASGIRFVVVEQSREVVERLRQAKAAAVCGDASEASVLIQGHVARARMLVIATPDPAQVWKMIETARIVNPRIEIVVRTHSEAEAALLRSEHLDGVFMGEEELAEAMTRHVLAKMSVSSAAPAGAAL